MKICFKCKEEKEVNDFYKHKGMKDGLLNKCKLCTKQDSINNYNEKTKNEEFVLKERKRSREKYHRLNYKEKMKKHDQKRPWVLTSTYKNLSRKYKAPKGVERHHWNYNKSFLEDFFFLNRKDHKSVHRFIKLCHIKRVYIVKKTNEILDTRLKHLKFMFSIGVRPVKI